MAAVVVGSWFFSTSTPNVAPIERSVITGGVSVRFWKELKKKKKGLLILQLRGDAWDDRRVRFRSESFSWMNMMALCG